MDLFPGISFGSENSEQTKPQIQRVGLTTKETATDNKKRQQFLILEVIIRATSQKMEITVAHSHCTSAVPPSRATRSSPASHKNIKNSWSLNGKNVWSCRCLRPPDCVRWQSRKRRWIHAAKSPRRRLIKAMNPDWNFKIDDWLSYRFRLALAIIQDLLNPLSSFDVRNLTKYLRNFFCINRWVRERRSAHLIH